LGNEGQEATRAFCQSWRLAAKDNKMLLTPRMEHSSRRRIGDCRLSKSSTSDFGLRTSDSVRYPPIVAAHECAIQGLKRGVGP
jgi:hypothetical protein